MKNVRFENPTIKHVYQSVGVIAGFVNSASKGHVLIEQVGITSGTISGDGSSSSCFYGSFIGRAEGTGNSKVIVKDSYASCKISGIKSNAAGLVCHGYENAGTIEIENCWWSGTIGSGKSSVGPFVSLRGANLTLVDGDSVTNCFFYYAGKYWDTLEHAHKDCKLTVEECLNQATFTGWDFKNTWVMGDGSGPELRVFLKDKQ